MKSSRERAENYLTVDRISKYKDKDIESLVKILDQHAAEQLERCADAVTYAWNHRNFDTSSYELMLRDACLNTTGESA